MAPTPPPAPSSTKASATATSTSTGAPVLRVDVVAARELLAEDLNGFSDPFVHLQLLDDRGHVLTASRARKTSIQKKTLSPVWNQSFLLGGDVDADVDLRLVTTLRFVVLDFDGFKRDDTLGVVDIPMDLLLHGDGASPPPVDEWFQLRKMKGHMTKDATGELHLKFARGPDALATPSTASKSASTTASTTASTSTSTTASTGGDRNLLYVTIDSGRDLLPMDHGVSSDPFVKLSLVGQKVATLTVEKTLKPHWDERFAFLLVDAAQTLELVVEDEDRTVNDFLGRAQLVLADVLPPTAAGGVDDQEVTVTVVLKNKKLIADKDRGTLQLRLLWTHDENADSIATSMRERRKQQRDEQKGPSLLTQLTSSLHIGSAAVGQAADDAYEANKYARVDDTDDDLLLDESDDEADGSVDGPEKALQFACVTVHRVEEMPPLDALTFAKETHKTVVPGGGIDAYVVAWLSEQAEARVRTRIHTRKGRRHELSTGFHETLMLPLPSTATTTSSSPVNVTLAVMDWDQIGGDECVSHLELRDVAALATRTQSGPFWSNLYGAPLVMCRHKEAVDTMNEASTVGSTYRGRVLLSVRLRHKPAASYEPQPQKRAAAKLPRDRFPASHVYRLRAHFISAAGLPEDDGQYYLTVSCGLHEVASTAKRARGRALLWNETEESDRMLCAVDASQIPDVILCLCTGDMGEKRVIVSYARVDAATLLAHGFGSGRKGAADEFGRALQWTTLAADPTTGAVRPADAFPGTVLVRVALGRIETSVSQGWDQRRMTADVARLAPYQLRVRVHGVDVGVATTTKATTTSTGVRLTVQCADQEVDTKSVAVVTAAATVDTTSAAECLCLDANLPALTLASPVLLHVYDSTSGARLGSASVSLASASKPKGKTVVAKAGDAPMVTQCSAQQLKTDTRPLVPHAQWMPLLDVDGTEGPAQVCVSVEVIRKMFPDEELPPPTATSTP